MNCRNSKRSARFHRLSCPRESCKARPMSPALRRVVSLGFFFRKSDSRRVRRFKCLLCNKSFSQATQNACFNQNKRQMNERLRKLLVSGVSQRRCAKLLGIHRKTVERKRRFLSELAAFENQAFLKRLTRTQGKFNNIQFDELESIE